VKEAPRLDLATAGTAELGQWATRQRWFAAKSASPRLTIVDTIPLAEDPRLAFALLEAALPSDQRELYQLVAVEGSDGWDPDALADPRAAATFARLLFEGAETETADARVRFHWHPDPSGARPATSASPGAKLLGGEQSNSSLLIDGQVVLKLFRRLHPGVNPELDMLRFLNDHGFAEVPRLSGWIELRSHRLDATLGVATTYVSGARDGWELTLDTLATVDAPAIDDLVVHLGQLGSVTGSMHTTLGSEPGHPDFAPEVSDGTAMASALASTERRLDRLLVDPVAAEVLGSRLHRLSELREVLTDLGRRAPSRGGRMMRTHGDLHLGQVLWTDGGWIVLDFEGEPATPFDERRHKRPPLRDVAGMLRSFAYAASAVNLQRGVDPPSGWEEAARAAYLDGYLAATDPALLPPGPRGWAEELAVFELEKAVYELAYEIDHRPGWVEIPLAGIARSLDQHHRR